jgi:hypothetical protein
MTQYMMSVMHDDEYTLDFNTPDMQRIGPKVGKFNEELTAAGAWVFGAGLKPRRETTQVFRPDESPVTDGPYAEVKEHMGGFWIIQAADDAQARDWAQKASIACEAPVELRPLQDEG